MFYFYRVSAKVLLIGFSSPRLSQTYSGQHVDAVIGSARRAGLLEAVTFLQTYNDSQIAATNAAIKLSDEVLNGAEEKMKVPPRLIKAYGHLAVHTKKVVCLMISMALLSEMNGETARLFILQLLSIYKAFCSFVSSQLSGYFKYPNPS